MVLPAVFAEARRRAVRLDGRTSLRVGGAPEFLFEPETEAEAGGLLAACRRAGVPVRVLGGGSNLLVSDAGVEGAVVATRRLGGVAVKESEVVVGAGVHFPRLVRSAAAWGIPFLSGCPGIPGSVGGAVAMNAGGRHGSTGAALLAVGGFDLEGRPYERRVRSDDLGYRETAFEEGLVTRAVFRRDPGLDPVDAQRIFVRALSEKRQAQPLGARSAGCTFRNPIDGVSAGRMIDEAGCKDLAVGGMRVSGRHANFLLNEGGATARDVQALIDAVRERVHRAFGVALRLEVRVWS